MFKFNCSYSITGSNYIEKLSSDSILKIYLQIYQVFLTFSSLKKTKIPR